MERGEEISLLRTFFIRTLFFGELVVFSGWGEASIDRAVVETVTESY